MDLKDYLIIESANVLAKKLGVHPNTIRNYAFMRNEPPVSMAFKIEEVTEGAVTALEISEKWKCLTKN
jgi:DNA-binding transcriptional regulator YdaS (Cro superfamily)